MVFLTGGDLPYSALQTDADLPIYRPANRNLLIILDPEARTLVDEARRLFPGGDIREHGQDGERPVLYSIHLSTHDLASIQGLEASYYEGTTAEGEPVITRRERTLLLDWGTDPPMSEPFFVEMEGLLYVPEWGAYTFEATSGAAFELLVDERSVLRGAGRLETTIELAEGRHAIRVVAGGSDKPLSVSWGQQDGSRELLGGHALYAPPVTGTGLLGTYFANADWSGVPHLVRIDAHLDIYFHRPALGRPYSVVWEGKIAVPIDGEWGFGLSSIDESTLFIDGEMVAEATEPNTFAGGRVSLKAGLHDIRVLFADKTNFTQVHLSWQPPGEARRLVPTGRAFAASGLV